MNGADRATNGTPNLLFVNRGDGTFEEVGERWQVRDSRWSYAAAFADIDEDGRTDVIFSNATAFKQSKLRKVIKTRASFPTTEAARKLLEY